MSLPTLDHAWLQIAVGLSTSMPGELQFQRLVQAIGGVRLQCAKAGACVLHFAVSSLQERVSCGQLIPEPVKISAICLQQRPGSDAGLFTIAPASKGRIAVAM